MSSPGPFSVDEIRMLSALAQFMMGLAGGKAARPASVAASPSVGTGGYENGLAADDWALDGQYADRDVRKDPKRWAGESMVGRRWSECPSDYLRCLADLAEWKADQDAKSEAPKVSPKTNKPYYEYDRKDARLMRAWALRNEGGTEPTRAAPTGRKHAPPDADYGDALSDSDIPFALPHDVSPRHERRRCRWERF